MPQILYINWFLISRVNFKILLFEAMSSPGFFLAFYPLIPWLSIHFTQDKLIGSDFFRMGKNCNLYEKMFETFIGEGYSWDLRLAQDLHIYESN